MGVEQLKGTEPALRPDRLRDEFLNRLLEICGDVRFLWLAELGQTTTSTGKSRHAATITWSETVVDFDAAPFRLGLGYAFDFNGTDEEGDTPDSSIHNFGDGVVDEPASWLVLAKPDANDTAYSLLAKEESASAEQWELGLNASGHLVLTLTDESASATLLGTYATAVGTDWTLLGSTYDGNGLSTGIKNFVDGLGVTTVGSGAGSYTAMENVTSKLHVASHYDTKALFFNGKIAFALLTGKELTADEQWAIKELINWFYDLSL